MQILFNPISSCIQLKSLMVIKSTMLQPCKVCRRLCQEFNALRDSLEHSRCHEQLGSQVCVVLPFQVVSLIHKMLHRLFIRFNAINEQLQCNNERQAFACDLLVDCMVASGSLVSFHSIRVAGTTQSTQINAHECERHRMFDLSPAEASAGKPPRRLALPGAIARQNFLPRPSSFLRTVARIAYICFIIHHCAYFTHTVREGWLEILTWIVHDSSGVVRIIQHFMLSSPAMQSQPKPQAFSLAAGYFQQLPSECLEVHLNVCHGLLRSTALRCGEA